MKPILTIFILLSLVVLGLAQTRNVVVGTNGAVVSPTNFWSADVTNARSGLGLGTAATNPATAFQPSSTVLSNLASSNGGSLTNLTASNVTGTIAISNGGSGATTAGGARTNLGLGATNNALFANISATSGADISGQAIFYDGILLDEQATIDFGDAVATTRTNLGATTVGDAVFTATNAAAAATAIGLGTTNFVSFKNVAVEGTVIESGIAYTGEYFFATDDENSASSVFLFDGDGAQRLRANARGSLGLGLPALTNTNTAGFNTSLYGSGTNPVLYNTNGEVVSPTNFWQVAPITTTFIESQPTTNQTTNIAAGRNLHIHSISPSTVGITNTIALPTTNSFNGDVALVVHQGPTSSVTAVRTAGAATNLITLNQLEEAVEFVYYNSVWQFNHNQSFVEPIFFSGTNSAANAAASRTNLGLPLTALTNTDVTNFRTAIGLGTTNNVAFSNIASSGTLTSTGVVTAVTNLNVGGAIAVTNAAATRTNLGIPLAALTNTNNANFQAAIFNTNSVPTNSANVNAVNFNTAIHWMEVNVVTNGVTNNFRIPLFK
jgi:hypothetical protein